MWEFMMGNERDKAEVVSSGLLCANQPNDLSNNTSLLDTPPGFGLRDNDGKNFLDPLGVDFDDQQLHFVPETQVEEGGVEQLHFVPKTQVEEGGVEP